MALTNIQTALAGLVLGGLAVGGTTTLVNHKTAEPTATQQAAVPAAEVLAVAADIARHQPSEKKVQIAATPGAPAAAQKPVTETKEVNDAVDDDDMLMYDEGVDNDDDYDDDEEY